MDAVSEQLKPSNQESHQQPIETEINEAERALGIENDYDRLIEANLFIDKKFLNYALVTESVQKPERIFGTKAWVDYLNGRKFAKQYGKQDLTVDFIRNLHKKLTLQSNPKIGGQIRKGKIIAASYDDGTKPVTYTQEQVKAIKANQLLTFQHVPPEDETNTTGFIVYPHEGPQTEQLVKNDLEELCQWFNETKKQDSYNPHQVAALLQHRLISLHPFSDSNGTLSRVLMNWSLESDGEAPSLIDDPSEDIVNSEQAWIIKVTEGSKQYVSVRLKQAALEEAEIDDEAALFNLGQDKVFYQYIFRHLKQAPPLPTNGDKHDHKRYEEFLANFKQEMNNFQKYMSSTTTIQTADGTREISQGGLISQEQIQFASTDKTQMPSEDLRKHFYSDIEVFRGGMIDGEINDQKICLMFQGYIGTGTGYRALQRSDLPATSQLTINPKMIGESMQYYNMMIASSYLNKNHPDIPNPYEGMSTPVQDLDTTIKDHIQGSSAIWNSPFASTSLDHYTSRSWARSFGGSFKNAKHGIVFKTLVPREGNIITFKSGEIAGVKSQGFPSEREVLVAGGLQPASITQIEVFDKSAAYANPSLIARKVVEDGKNQIVIEDHREEFLKVRTFIFNPETAKFEFAGEQVTETPSTREKYVPKIGLGIAKFDKISNYLDIINQEYESPFKKEKILLSKIQDFNIEYFTQSKHDKLNINNIKKENINEFKILDYLNKKSNTNEINEIQNYDISAKKSKKKKFEFE